MQTTPPRSLGRAFRNAIESYEKSLGAIAKALDVVIHRDPARAIPKLFVSVDLHPASVTYLASWENVDRRRARAVARWAHRQRRRDFEVRVEWVAVDDRGIPKQRTASILSPDRRYVLEITYVYEPPGGIPHFLARVLQVRDRSILWDGGFKVFFHDTGHRWARDGRAWVLELNGMRGAPARIRIEP